MLKNYRGFIILLFLLLGISYSCRKNVDSLLGYEPRVPVKVQWAKEYYDNILFKNEGDVVINKSTKTSAANAKPNKKRLLWEKSIPEESQLHTYVEIPLIYTRKIVPIHGSKDDLPDKDVIKSSFSRLVIYKDKSGKIDESIVTYIPDKSYLKGRKGDISHNTISKLDKDFSGYLQYKKWDGTYLFTLRIQNGNLVRRYFVSKTKTDNPAVSDIVCDPTYTIEYEVTCYYTGENTYFDYCDAPIITSIYVDGQVCFDDGNWSPTGGGGGSPPAPNDCAGVSGGNAYLSDCGCIGGLTGIQECSKDPCLEKILVQNRSVNFIVNSQNASIRTNSTTNEYGAEQNLTGFPGNNYKNTPVRTNGQAQGFTGNFTWNDNDGYTIGVSHGHPANGAPSPADVFWGLNNGLNNVDLVAAGTASVDAFKERWSVTVVTATEIYVVTIKDWAALQTLQSSQSIAAFNLDYIAKGQAYGSANPLASYGDVTVNALLLQFGSAINVYRATGTDTIFKPLEIDSNNHVSVKSCP